MSPSSDNLQSPGSSSSDPVQPGRHDVIRGVRDAIWSMRDPEDMGRLLDEIRQGMVDLGIPLLYCGVNLIDHNTNPPSVVSHSMSPKGKWTRLQSKGSQTVLGFWQRGEIVHRRDLAHDDPYGEHAIFPNVGCIIDVPFAQGTLAASSRAARAFSDDDVDLLRDMALLLEDGFRRMEELRVLQVRLKLRQLVWQMRSPQDIVHVMATLRDSFAELGLAYTACGLNLVTEGGSFVTHTMERHTDWMPPPAEGPQPVIERFWRERTVAYRKDLDRDDPHGEREWMEGIFEQPIRCVIDIPFSHGTLALNHTEPEAFSSEQVQWLQDLAGVLEEAFRRMDDLTTLEQQNVELQRSLDEKVVLLKEVHHRVKNNLQVVSSLLSLRADTIDDPDAIRCFEDTRTQVQSMAMIHERLYEADDLARLDCAAYVRALAENVFASYGVDPQQVQLVVEARSHTVSVDTAVQCGLIVHELVTNALKHAFPDNRRGTVRVEAVAEQDMGRLRVSDDGVGMADTVRSGALGLRLVGDMARQLGSSVHTDSANGTTSFEIEYPLDSPDGE